MIDRESALELAEQFMDAEVRGLDEEVVVASIKEFPDTWVVSYQSRAFIETGLISHMLVGGGPIMIQKLDGTITVALSRRPLEDQVLGDEISCEIFYDPALFDEI